jgi:hypothetical protein
MIAPTSHYGCGSLECEPCYGDAEWQAAKEHAYYLENPDEAEADGYDLDEGWPT